ncbi:MAG: hypothetical protein ORN29_06735 [Rhodoferax sp.]|nr:hypothetical protein [Rhodoferax sp.]
MPPAAHLLQTNPHGQRYDFNNGLPPPQGNWRVDILDDSSRVLLHSCQITVDRVISPWKHFIPYGNKVTDLNSEALLLNTALHVNSPCWCAVRRPVAENWQYVCTSSITGTPLIQKITALLPDTAPARD